MRAREALTRARAGGVAEADAELAALPAEALEEETGSKELEMPVPLEMADLESAPPPELESVAAAPPQPASAAPPRLSLVPPPG